MRRACVVLSLLALGACRRGARPEAEAGFEFDDATLAPGNADAGAPSACRVVAQSVLRPDEGAGDADDPFGAAVTGLRLARTPGGVRAYWFDGRAEVLQAGTRTVPLGPGERSDLVVRAGDPGHPVPIAGWIRDTAGERVHFVRVGEALDRGCRYVEQRDESLALALAATADGVLVAWDQEGPGRWPGSIQVQGVPWATLAPERGGSLPVCPSAERVTPFEHDATEPVLVSLPRAGALLLWLNARDLDPLESNDNAANLWGRVLDARGRPLGAVDRILRTPGRRFGVSALARPDGVWVAYRSSDETDSLSRDDGDVAVVRVSVEPGGALRPGDPLVLTVPGADATGAPVVVPRAGGRTGVEVFWQQREGSATMTWHRAVNSTGGTQLRAEEAFREPRLLGLLPAAGDERGLWLARATPRNGITQLRVSCAR